MLVAFRNSGKRPKKKQPWIPWFLFLCYPRCLWGSCVI